MSSINAIIVEDQAAGMENLVYKIKQYCPLVNIVDQCRTGEAAVKSIHQHRPDAVFLDIHLGSMHGFDVLRQVEHIRFSVIFTTADPDMAIEAINSRANTVAYLVKPIQKEALVDAVQRAWTQAIQASSKIEQVALTVGQKLFLVDLDDIIYCEADNNRTKIHLHRESDPLVVGRTLLHYETTLPLSQFFRIHRSYLIHRKYLLSFIRSDGGFVTMKMGKREKKLSISQDKRTALENWIYQS